MVESYNKQHTFGWVINHINIPSGQCHGYTEWEPCEAHETIFFYKSRYYEIIGKFGVTQSTITGSLNIISPSLKCSSLKTLWDIMSVEKVTKRIV